jgi:hypothetical protein
MHGSEGYWKHAGDFRNSTSVNDSAGKTPVVSCRRFPPLCCFLWQTFAASLVKIKQASKNNTKPNPQPLCYLGYFECTQVQLLFLSRQWQTAS